MMERSGKSCRYVCVCVSVCECVFVSVCSRHAYCPEADKGASSSCIVHPPILVVYEGVTLGAVGCGRVWGVGGGGGALLWGVWFLGLGCVRVWCSGPWVNKPR